MSEQEPIPETPEEIEWPVRIVAGHAGGAMLVEWVREGAYRRACLPGPDIRQGPDGTVATLVALERGIPYGIAWEQYIEVTATPASIANELRRRGVWTWRDITLPAVVEANRAFDLGAFLRRADAEEGSDE